MIEGIYMDGKTSKRVKARLEVFSDYEAGLCFHIDQADTVETINIMMNELQISSRLGNTPREIMFADEQLFITDDNDAIDQMQKKHSASKFSGIIHTLESSLPLVITGTMVVLLCVWLMFSIGIPKAAEYIAFQLPQMTNKHFSSTLPLLDEALFDPSELPLETQQRVQDFSQPYLEKYQDLDAKLVFRSGAGINAFALPDGHIVFTDGIVRLMQHDEELIAVLFHELGHLKYKHLIRRTLQDSMVTIMIILMTGDVDSFDLITGIPTLLLDLNYILALIFLERFPYATDLKIHSENQIQVQLKILAHKKVMSR